MNAVKLRAKYDSDPAGVAPEVQAALDQYAFYHSIELAPGIKTQGIPWTNFYVPPFLDVCRKFDFQDKRVLDLGCRDGVASLTAEQLGAAEIFSLDNSYSPGLVNFIIPFNGSIIKPVEANLYDLEKLNLGAFDIVICAGLLYHLQYPFWGLRLVRDAMKSGGTLILESAYIEAFEDLPVLVYPTGETSFYEPTSPTFYNLAGLRNALSELGFGEFELHHTLRDSKVVDVGTHFPAYAQKFGELSIIHTGRAILTCKKLGAGHNTRFKIFEKTVPWDGRWAQDQIRKWKMKESAKDPDSSN